MADFLLHCYFEEKLKLVSKVQFSKRKYYSKIVASYFIELIVTLSINVFGHLK